MLLLLIESFGIGIIGFCFICELKVDGGSGGGMSGEGSCCCFSKGVCFCNWFWENCVVCVVFVVGVFSLGIWGICFGIGGCVSGVCVKLGMVFFVCCLVVFGIFGIILKKD